MSDAARPTYKTLEDAIGGTPLVRLQRVPGSEVERRGNVVLGKLDGTCIFRGKTWNLEEIGRAHV